MDMSKDAIQLWCAYPDELLTDSVAQACVSLLSEEERIRWQALKFDRHRREYLTTRALVRTALSHNHPLAPEAWRFQLNAYGKPAVDPNYGLRFNLSNSASLVVCLVSNGAEVGVDIEPHAHAEKIVGVAPEVFSEQELAQMLALQDASKLDRALSLWTLKESYIKARGMGLALPLQKFSFLFGGPEGIRLELDPCLGDEAGRWRFYLLDHAGHRIALMTEQTNDPEIQLWNEQPLLTAPTRLAASQQKWFPALAS